MRLIEITSIKEYEYNGNVYDLEIEDDHTYNINGIIVHNSDYVMLGSILNKALESAGENYVQIKDTNEYMLFDNYLTSFDIFDGGHFDTSNITPENLMAYGSLYKKFRGMSTKEVQKSLGNEVLKTSEGIVKYHKVEYTLNGWVENFEHYLRSAMSYTNSLTLNDFIGEVNTIVISENAFNRYNK